MLNDQSVDMVYVIIKFVDIINASCYIVGVQQIKILKIRPH